MSLQHGFQTGNLGVNFHVGFSQTTVLLRRLKQEVRQTETKTRDLFSRTVYLHNEESDFLQTSAVYVPLVLL